MFSYLAMQFGYPDILDGSGPEVLPRLLALGTTGRAVWAVYALLPLLLIPAAAGTYSVLLRAAPTAVRVACTFAVVAAVSMFLGLARWPSVHWELARAYGPASPDARVAMDAVFSGLNVYLGNFVGEFLGEISLNAYFVLSAVALLRAGRRWTAYGGFAAGGLGLIAAFRNVTPAVDLISGVDNYVLPLWLAALGVVLVRWRSPAV